MNNDELALRPCFREPIVEIAEAAKYLSDAVDAHLQGKAPLADKLIRRADIKAIRDWTESLWGSNSPFQKFRIVAGAPPIFLKVERKSTRMPTTSEKRFLLQRDGFHCRFCGIPLIRNAVRNRIKRVYPEALPWGRTNLTQHAAFQAMWVQYDHLTPHARGGGNDPENMVITCAPCNFGRMNYTLEEVGLIDPRTRNPICTSWDGLERFH
jgi:hypothetical protein